MAYQPKIVGRRTRRTGQGPDYDLLSINFQTRDLIHLIDKLTGQFRDATFKAALHGANERAAIEIQKGMRKHLEERIGDRPQRQGKRLQKALTDEGNRIVKHNGFVVGVEAWLNKSPAAMYWRQVEEGMGAYVTRALFSNNGGPGGVGKVGRPFSRPNEGAMPHMRMKQYTRPGTTRGVPIRVKAFPGYHFMRDGGADAFQKLDMADRYQRALRSVGINVSKGDPNIFK